MNDENAARQLSQNPGNDPQKDGERLAGQTPPKYTNPSNVARDDAERIDELILSIAQQASFIPRGKTISADMFDAKVALLALLREARIDELSWTRQSGRTDLEVVNRINEFGYEQRQHAILKPREK